MYLDKPIFEPSEWKLTKQQKQLCRETRSIASNKFVKRAFKYDSDATFPSENFTDLFNNNLMGICIPKKYGGRDADLKTYMLAASEIGRYCGATALTFNMHVSSCLWTGFLSDQLDMDESMRKEHHKMREMHYERILKKGSIYAQPFSEGNASAAGKKAFGTIALRTESGWIVNGKKIFASLSGHANYYGTLCTELLTKNSKLSRSNTMYIAIPANQKGVRVVGDWDPLGMRGTVSRTLLASFENHTFLKS